MIVATAELYKSRGFCLAGDVYGNIRLPRWMGRWGIALHISSFIDLST